jgi:hypothetical protein
VAAGFGLPLLASWLIEYDKDFQPVTATRIAPPVLASHVLAAAGGLVLWIAFLILDDDTLAWYSVIALVLAAALGLTTAIRRISVYRAKRASDRVALARLTGPDAGRGYSTRLAAAGPPERNFPLTVVITHGLFAVTTLTLVLLAALGVS